MSFESPEFEDLIEQSLTELGAKTDAHRAWGLGTEDDWGLEQDEGELVLTRSDGVQARAQAQIVGTFDSGSGTWLWSWANPSIARPLAECARRVKRYGEQRRVDRLTAPKWPAEEADCWAM